jgi:hypothetical protein
MFFLSGSEHSLTADAGSAWAPSPWEAAQRAATDALYKLRCGEPPPPDCTTTNDSPAWPSAPVHSPDRYRSLDSWRWIARDN